MENKLYLITLSSRGDSMIKLVNESVWDWIFSDFESNDNSYHEKLSEEVKAEFVKYHIPSTYIKDDKPAEEVFITIGSYENDRAIHAPGKSFESLKEVLKYLKKNDLEIEDEYEGSIY